MADKQLARSTEVDPNTFSDDDPLSELARIVGYDNRPALQQLQELERHRDSVRYDPIVDLEEELMREFDAYDAPDTNAPKQTPRVEAVQAPVVAVAPARVEPVYREPAPVEPVAPPVAARPVEPVSEARPEPTRREPARLEPTLMQDEPALDLDQELEMSLGSAPEPVFVAQPPVQRPVDAVQPARAAVDPLLETVERFPVAPGAAARSVSEAARKNNFPFTPNFSRATPVAPNGGASRTFTTPLPPAPPPAPAMARVFDEPPVVAAAPAAPLVSATPVAAMVAAPAAVAVEEEPDIDFDSFEIDLSDIELDLDEETQEFAALEEPVEDDAEPELPFDPSLIADADYGVHVTGEIDVPQLPVVEEADRVPDRGDYDLDIDAEMAQIFSVGRQDSERRGHGLAMPSAVAAGPATARASHEEFADFERAMEEDFRRSISQRQEVIGQGDRYADQSAGNDNEARPRGRLFLLAGAAALVLIAGGVGAYTLIGGSSPFVSGGEPQIILADKSPTKMVPLEKGGKTVPNQDKAVYDRVAGAQEEAPQQDSLVSSTEEPMDVVQRTLTPESLPLEGSNGLEALPADDEGADRLMPDDGEAETAAAEEDAAPAVAPRKVRTMIVKPDGTLVARDETLPAEPAETVASAEPMIKTVKTSVPSTPALAPAEQDTAEDDVGALAAAADATVPDVAASIAKAQPLPDVRPVTKPVETAKAVQKPVDTFATSVPAEASPVQTASIAPGSYVVQVASLPSEAEAQKSYKSLSGKYGSVIAGRGVDIKRADIAGKGTYYRVRIPAGTRDEANALCSRLKSAGGSCLVTR